MERTLGRKNHPATLGSRLGLLMSAVRALPVFNGELAHCRPTGLDYAEKKAIALERTEVQRQRALGEVSFQRRAFQ